MAEAVRSWSRLSDCPFLEMSVTRRLIFHRNVFVIVFSFWCCGFALSAISYISWQYFFHIRIIYITNAMVVLYKFYYLGKSCGTLSNRSSRLNCIFKVRTTIAIKHVLKKLYYREEKQTCLKVLREECLNIVIEFWLID